MAQENWKNILDLGNRLWLLGTDERLRQDSRSGAIPIAKGRLLDVVIEAKDKGGIRLKDLAEKLELSPGTVSVAVESLVSQGMLVREHPANDRRSIRILPTVKTVKGCILAEERMSKVMERVFEDVAPEDREKFWELVEKLRNKTMQLRNGSKS